jgi:hypothetical protein
MFRAICRNAKRRSVTTADICMLASSPPIRIHVVEAEKSKPYASSARVRNIMCTSWLRQQGMGWGIARCAGVGIRFPRPNRDEGQRM